MEKIVYILGAGFSAPLGLPVVANFLEKSKDQYLQDPGRYAHFQGIFNEIDALARIKNSFETDLHNIEEILSLLEMQTAVGRQKKRRDRFIRYLRDVIEFHTPASTHNCNPFTSYNWWDQIWEGGYGAVPYGILVGSISALTFEQMVEDPLSSRHEQPVVVGIDPDRQYRYDVITLNYDRVLENTIETVNRKFGSRLTLPPPGVDSNESTVILPVGVAKLHGSVELGDIVPPTWGKSIPRAISDAWRHAHQALENANYVRIVGYSLPEADGNVRYLLKSAAAKAPHLKRVDVICLDPTKTVRARYQNFVQHPRFRFAAQSTEDYLTHVARYAWKHPLNQKRVGIYRIGSIEASHEEFMQFAAG
ncbi:MAG: hypothetical protein U0V87_15820 [Acidobacteriota bacterium]